MEYLHTECLRLQQEKTDIPDIKCGFLSTMAFHSYVHAKRAILVRVDLQRSSHEIKENVANRTKESKTVITVLIMFIVSLSKNIHNTIAN